MDLREYIARQIRELRRTYNSGEGISQAKLAKEIGMAQTYISKLESCVYFPHIAHLENLAHFFGISISHFFPQEKIPTNENIQALLRIAKELPPEDLEGLKHYAEFRHARVLYQKRRRPPRGRKRKKQK